MKKTLPSYCLYGISLFLLILTNQASAASYNIGTGGGSAFDKITSLLQDWTDFMVGPFGTAAVVGSVILGAVLWAIMPKAHILALALRAVLAATVILNIGIWMGWLGG